MRVGTTWAETVPSGCTAPTTYTVAGGGAFCPGDSVNVTLSGSQSGVTYQLLKDGVPSGGTTSGTGSGLSWSVNAVGVYSVKTTSAGGYCEVVMTGSAVVTANTAPAITGQPGNQTVALGQTANFTVTATGSGLAYQWQADTGGGFANVTDGTGANTASYTTPATTSGMNSYQYRCVVSGTCTPGVTSDPATLTVISCTTAGVSTSPADQTVTSPTAATFAVTATGSEPTYQWQVSVDSGSTWNPVAGGTGANTASYTTPATTGLMNGHQFRCVVSVACDSSTVPSAAATLTVNCDSANVATDPANQTVTAPTAATFAITATGSEISYQWEVSTDSGSSWNPVAGGSGANTSSYTTASTTGAMNGRQFRCVVTSACNSSTDTSAPATLTVNCSPVNVTVDPVNKTANLGSTANFTVTATGSPTLSYQWEVSTDGGSTWGNVSSGSGGTSASYTTAATTLDDDGNQYRCIVTSSCDSSTDTSAVATLTVVDPATLQFRSAATGNWGDASTWESFDGSTWAAAASAPNSANDAITIRSPHIVSVAANVTGDQITVETGGTLTLSANLTVAHPSAGTDLEVSGTLNITGGSSALTLAANATVAVGSGGLMIHNGLSAACVSAGSGSAITFASGSKFVLVRDGGTVPTATWNAGSTCEVQPVSGRPANLGQTFHHFVWNAPSQTASLDLAGRGQLTVNGNLIVMNANGQEIKNWLLGVSGTYGTLSIGGDLRVTNCNAFNLVNSSGSGSGVLNVSGSMIFASTANINIGASGVNVAVNFNGASPQVYSNPNTVLKPEKYLWKVNSGATLTLQNSLTVSGSAPGATFTVDGTLIVGAGSIIGGTGAFTLNPGSTLAGLGTVNFATTVNGTLAPGTSPGTLAFGDDLLLAAGSTADFEINNSGGVKTSDLANASGQPVTYGGRLRLTYSGDTLAAGDSFNLFDAASFAGSFTGLELVNWPSPALRVDTSSLGTDGTITVAANTAPVAQDITLGCALGETVTFAVIGGKFAPADANADALKVVSVTPASSGASGYTDTTVTYAASGSAGTNTFLYTVADPSGATDTGVVTVIVSASAGNSPNITGLTGTAPSITIHFLGIPNTSYAIERSENLGDWTQIAPSVTTGANGQGSYTDTSAPNPGPAYYRTRHVP